jgi:hypothetical protein
MVQFSVGTVRPNIFANEPVNLFLQDMLWIETVISIDAIRLAENAFDEEPFSTLGFV